MRRSVVLALASVAVLSACATGPGDDAAGGDPADSTAAGDIAQADDDLQVTLDPGDGSPVQEWTLSCRDTPEGSHPDAGAACEHLSGMRDPFAPLVADAVCTEQYGGPETARVIGRWDGEPVDLELSRSDGCRIAQWDALGPLLAFDLD
ncbi:SSI family serine proteinase inhibitor [Blastococcus sp. SYSU D00922]